MKTPKTFITYSHKNAIQRESLETALAVMIQNGEIEIWSDAKILPGDKWGKKIKMKLEESDVLLYLVSPFSLASKNCNKELTDILRKTQNIEVIPIILEDCDFLHHSLLTQFEALPTRDEDILPISHWKRQSEAWQNVVDGIRNKLTGIADKSTQEKSDTPPSTSQEASVPRISKQAIAETFFDKGNFFLMLKNYDAAIFIYTEALKLKPTAKVYNNRGAAYEHKGDYDNAFANYEKAIKLNPNFTMAYNNRGNIYDIKGDHDNALADYDKAITLNPNFAAAYNNRGFVYNNKGGYDKAITNLNKAIELNPNFAEPYTNRGIAYAKKGEPDKAIADFDKAIELDPNSAETYNNRGNIYGSKGEYSKALSDINKAIELNPNYTHAYFNRGALHLKEAKQDFQTALKLAEQQGNNPLVAEIKEIIAALPDDSDS